MSRTRLKCSLLWKLCRKHGWGSPVPEEVLVDLALESSDPGAGKLVVRELVEEPYIGFRDGEGYLRIQVEPTLSRFEQAGGFDAYDERDVLADLDEWE